MDRLSEFGLDWWVDRLRPIADQFVAASSGRVDRAFLKDIYKVRAAYGRREVNGWIARLFPYLKGIGGRYDRRNPLVTGGEDAITSDAIPCGWSRAPVRARTRHGERSLDFVAGFFGVEQDRETLALRPRIGWAVCDMADLDLLVDRTAREHRIESSRAGSFPKAILSGCDLPADLFRLYDRFGAASPFSGAVKILPAARLRTTRLKPWIVFADVRDGSWLAIRSASGVAGTTEWQVVHGVGEPPHRATIVARSLGEWLRRTLDSKDGMYFRRFWFRGYGDALA